MKKKISLFITLALTTFLTAGCSIQDVFKKKEQTPTEQEGEKETEQQETVKVESVVLTPNSKYLEVGEKYQINASVLPENANQNLKYKTNNSHVCSVSSSGLITAYEIGTAIIKVSSEENPEIFENFAAVVEAATEHYTVSFNANGANGTMSPVSITESTYVIPQCTFTYPLHKFSKWALNSTTGTQYGVGETITNIESNITLFALWEEDLTNNEIDDDYGDYYSTISADLTGQSLINALHSLNDTKRVRTMGYAGLKTWGKYTEVDWTGKSNVSGKMFGFYDNALICNEWDNQATWNREHVWPKSLGGNKVEGDMHMPRPASVSINSERGNKFYGTGSSLYDPGQYEANYRGVAARIIFYCAIADTSLDIIDSNNGGSTEMGKLSDLLRWNLQYAPDRTADAPLTLRIEQNRNKEMYSREGLQGNRNPFIDHPEYACKIWGSRNATTKSICGIN